MAGRIVRPEGTYQNQSDFDMMQGVILQPIIFHVIPTSYIKSISWNTSKFHITMKNTIAASSSMYFQNYTLLECKIQEYHRKSENHITWKMTGSAEVNMKWDHGCIHSFAYFMLEQLHKIWKRNKSITHEYTTNESKK